jgi:hypothetical protein
LGTSGADNRTGVDGFLLVDDRDGRVLAELTDPIEAFGLLDEIKEEHPELAGALCLVRFDGRQRSLIGTDTTTRVRTLGWNRPVDS